MSETTTAQTAQQGPTSAGAVRLLAVREEPLSVDEVYDAVRDVSAGGVVVFVGAVRDHDSGKGVERLGYTAHPTALARLHEVAGRVADQFPAVALAAVHRVGDLRIGDLAVVVGASAVHRGEAFAAARALIDDLKDSVPIWKHQEFTDGSQEWVGTP
jgi:molybdopterin synthase catalytic subunit